MRKIKVEIIEEIASFYNSTNRGYFDGNCAYNTHDGRKCAVGRCMTDEGIEKFGNCSGGVKSLAASASEENTGKYLFSDSDSANEHLDSLLKEEYRGHEIFFWDDLQSFHDAAHNWNEDGLTEDGKRVKQALIEKYKPKTYKFQEVIDFIKEQPDDRPVDFSHPTCTDKTKCLMAQFAEEKGVKFKTVSYDGDKYYINDSNPVTLIEDMPEKGILGIVKTKKDTNLYPVTFGEIKKNMGL